MHLTRTARTTVSSKSMLVSHVHQLSHPRQQVCPLRLTLTGLLHVSLFSSSPSASSRLSSPLHSVLFLHCTPELHFSSTVHYCTLLRCLPSFPAPSICAVNSLISHTYTLSTSQTPSLSLTLSLPLHLCRLPSRIRCYKALPRQRSREHP